MFFIGYIKIKLLTLRSFLFSHEPGEFGFVRKILFIALRFAWMTVEEYWRNRGTQKSAALAYTSVLSMFPLLAVISIAATYFYAGGPQQAEDAIVSILARYVLPTEPVYDPVEDDVKVIPASAPRHGIMEDNIRMSFRQFRENAGKIAGIGSVGLLIAAMALFGACENFFNQIWRVQAQRSIFNRFRTFSTALVSVPVLAAVGTVLSRSFREQLGVLEQSNAVGALPLWLANVATHLTPFLFFWLALSLAIVVIPNTRVSWPSALLGGMISSFLWLFAKKIFFSYIGLSEVRRSVFEAFGATLIFLVWLYFLWVIVLVGVQIAYVSQNFGYVYREHFKKRHDLIRDPRLYVAVLGRIAESFYKNLGGIKFEELRAKTNLRESELEEVVTELSNRNLVAARDDDRLILERPPEHVRLSEIFDISCCGRMVSARQDEDDSVHDMLVRIDRVLPEQFGEMTLKDLLKSDEKTQ